MFTRPRHSLLPLLVHARRPTSESFPLLSRRWFGLVTKHRERKRFYKQADVYQSEDGKFGVQLDSRSLRTPLRHVFLVPTESLATAVCQEWEAQTTFIQPPLMHLTALCNTVIDCPSLADTKPVLLEDALQYLVGDTVCFRATEPDELVELQEKEWDPILLWFNQRYGVNLVSTTGLCVPAPSNDLMNSLSVYIKGLDEWGVTGFHFGLRSCKSLILTCALFEGHTDPLETCELSRLEVRHQINKWGLVEWQHEIEAQDLLSRLSASLLIHQLSGEELTQITY